MTNGEQPSQGRKRETVTDKDKRSIYMGGIKKLIEWDIRFPYSAVANICRYNGIGVGEKETTRIAVSALFAVYDSKADLTDDDIVNRVRQETDSDWAIDRVVDRLYEKQYLLESDTPGQGTVFGVPGLWLIENAFMHGEDGIDSMAVAQRNLRKDGFFSQS